MQATSQYGSCGIPMTSNTVDFVKSNNESISTTVTRVDKVSKQYLITECDYNGLDCRAKAYCTLGGIAVIGAVGCVIYEMFSGRRDDRVINSILLLLVQAVLFFGLGLGMSSILVQTRECTLKKLS